MENEKKGWFEERLGLKKPFDWFLNRKVPRGVGWWYVLGSATLVVFIIQLFTGLFLMLNYSPSPDHAYDSVQYIMNQVAFGSLIRSIHFYAASAMVILIVLHLLRVYFMAAYKYPRELTWVIGVLLLLLVMGSSFTGYLLPWDQRAYWATNVAAGISGEVPLIGPWIQKILIGSSQIGTLTLTRFFTFHVGALPALIGLLIGFHIFTVIKQGISAPPSRMKLESATKKDRKKVYEESYEASKKGGESFFPDTLVRDSIFALIIVAIIIILAVVFTHVSEAPADPTSTNYNPRPEWYFLFFFEFLKFFPGWLEPVAAILIPVLAIIILIVVPFLDRGIGRFWARRKPALAIGGLVVLALIALEVGGAITAPTRPSVEVNQLVLDGQKVYRDVNCSYCHSINGVGGAIGPDLTNIASKLTKNQLTTYLQNPDLMVPNTLHPKLQFTPDEMTALVAYLETLGPPVSYSSQAPQLFAQNCSSCHTINGQGGTEGPDLSKEGSIRNMEFLQSFISDPRSVIPNAGMPAFHNALTPDQIKDIAAYLFNLKGQTPSPTPPVSISPTATSTTTINASQLYSNNCASCHGTNREGGYGPPLTTSALGDDSVSEIADVINRGTRGGMPSFSSTLGSQQIDSLANYLKTTPP
jgi:ubiquinol-cytochrome c reductase cytochrome b subunit